MEKTRVINSDGGKTRNEGKREASQIEEVKCKPGEMRARHFAKCAEILTISKQERNRGVSVLSCYIGIPKQAIQNEHSQPCDITVVCQRDQFTINCLQREDKARPGSHQP